MPSALSYPGVYIEEISSGVRTITGVATSITAFIGATLRGPLDTPVRVQSFAEFERNFGSLWRNSPLSYAVNQFFQNGGSDALIVRVANGGKPATGAADTLQLVAASLGEWGAKLRVRVDLNTRPEVPKDSEQLFNLTVRDADTGAVERFLNVSVLPAHPRFVGQVLEQESNLVRLVAPAPAARPAATSDATKDDPLIPGFFAFNSDGDNGATITDAQVSAPALTLAKSGIWALEKVDLFNLLCIPPFSFDTDIGAQTRTAAAEYCGTRRALYIADPLLAWNAPSDITDQSKGPDGLSWGLDRNKNVALYFPRLRCPDPLQEGRLAEFAPCGAVAGLYARTDSQRGVWKAPAGIEATLSGVSELTVKLTDGENGQLNPLGVNCLRAFSVIGRVVWGARTLRGADSLQDEWKYVPVRRLALFIEESLFRGTQWVVFEPNDEPLWAQIRLNLGAFMQNLFRQGAFQGRSPREAYFVKCDRETTTQNDINQGIVNIVVGFAPLKPAEFVVIKLQQMAGQIEV
ncbi:phage tail sheath subtilisin-like domain-containing protein [Crenobacter sp. SG2303]|uniref:Phage tail sheath subtilisin-like domain-containing protein n=1 Tax=Crenobacter oryzisoli TaxID=3056844 RepID=A0ABT7XNG2_9NEIS|nr:phage tail sheath C-terminal domain-containing protein [Crenobacter sp. SG2303]MDN0075099.1 phage tail sheath subtilisin-like domain-containing protein [Crenobacter sp. SG2303]MDN0076293.1 phage tail sheath subtilisin-like domain-containing protein [Crenobacter sp. SG2303]